MQALSLHNSTVYRWNRPCYGIYKGKPSLRIESRMFPSGPTILDQVANSAFWLGLMIFYKYGGKQLYYFNTYDGQGELDIDKLNESSNITVDEEQFEEEDCESCVI